MGLTDRDGMRSQSIRGEALPSFMRPPEERSAASILTMVLTFLFALFVLYKSADWWLAKRAMQQQQPATHATRLPATAEQQQLRPTSPQPTQSPAYPVPQTESRAVTKCVAGDKTSYSDGACPPGSTASTVTIDPRVNVVETPRLALVTPAAKPAVVADSSDSMRAPQVASAYSQRKAECEALSAHIEQLDAWARQPQSAQRQDWIRDERKKARDRQFGIRC